MSIIVNVHGYNAIYKLIYVLFILNKFLFINVFIIVFNITMATPEDENVIISKTIVK